MGARAGAAGLSSIGLMKSVGVRAENTVIIDRDGVVRRVIQSEFGIAKHIDEALETLRTLPS